MWVGGQVPGVRTSLLLILTLSAGDSVSLPAQEPAALPGGARTDWIVAGPEQVVGWFAFDPALVADRLPDFARFVTIGELASGGVPWAVAYLAEHASQAGWGVSFLEIVRADTFAIDERQPEWPDDGAIAMWFARILPREAATPLGPGLPLLMLEFWVPDSAYVTFMLRHGHYASYADVRLRRHANDWEGSISGEDFTIKVSCTPGGAESGGSNSRGMQTLVPPKTSGPNTILDITFAGHRERTCSEPHSWTIQGYHALSGAIQIEAASFQWGYRLRGGASF